MKKVKCFDVVSDVVENANAKFCPGWKLNEENYDILKEYCEAIDAISRDCGISYIDATVLENSKRIRVEIGTDSMEVLVKNHPFNVIIKCAVSFGFLYNNQDEIGIYFVFPRLWDKTEVI